MANVRARTDNKLLLLDFYYRGVRCRERTALPDTAENRKKVQALLNRVKKEIRHGVFDYASTFPASTKAARFAESTVTGGVAQRLEPVNRIEVVRDPVAVAIPTFRDFSETWRGDMAPQWRHLHRESVDVIFKADILAVRAALAELPGQGNKKLSAPSINKIIGLLRQCLQRLPTASDCRIASRASSRSRRVGPASIRFRCARSSRFLPRCDRTHAPELADALTALLLSRTKFFSSKFRLQAIREVTCRADKASARRGATRL